MKDLNPIAKFYAPLGFLTNDKNIQLEWLDELNRAVETGDIEVFESTNGALIYFRYLEWDTNFFHVPTYRIEYSNINSDFSEFSFNELYNFLSGRHQELYLFAEVPSEDIRTIKGLSGSGYKLIETRLTYFNDKIRNFESTRRFSVRQASIDDIPTLNATAIDSVNVYDRFHADDFFTELMANNFLAKYIENSVLGYADEVIVPSSGPANAFLTANYIKSSKCFINKKLAKMVLSAVAPSRTGWYVKLIGEMTMKFKENDIDIAFMTTQSTNRAVLKVWNSFGYQFGRSTHIFSKFKR